MSITLLFRIYNVGTKYFLIEEKEYINHVIKRACNRQTENIL